MILIAVGSNKPGPWGETVELLPWIIAALRRNQVNVAAFSPVFLTAAMGPRQSPYVNAVAVVRTSLSPRALLAALKSVEKTAGRRAGQRWGPRELDLDILAYHGRIINWTMGGGRRVPIMNAKLIIPHAGLHLRPFVLQPLACVAPRWHHPVFGATAIQLQRGKTKVKGGEILSRLY